jgi:hypothetical protein
MLPISASDCFAVTPPFSIESPTPQRKLQDNENDAVQQVILASVNHQLNVETVCLRNGRGVKCLTRDLQR